MSAVEAASVENSFYKLTLNENGDITSLFDKRINKELVKAGKAIRLALFTENKSFEWPAWEILKETVDATPISITEDVKVTLCENGALRKTLCVEKRHDDSFSASTSICMKVYWPTALTLLTKWTGSLPTLC